MTWTIISFTVTVIRDYESRVKTLNRGKARSSGKAIKSSLNKLSPYMFIYRTNKINIKEMA